MPLLPTFHFDRHAAGRLLASDDTKATVLLVIALAAYGPTDVMGDAETGEEPVDSIELWTRFEEDFHIKIPEKSECRLLALIEAMSSESYFDDPNVFASISNALTTGDIGDALEGVLNDLTVPEVLWGVFEVELNRGDGQEFGHAVVALMNAVSSDEKEDPGEGRDELPKQESQMYFGRFVNEQVEDLERQLRELGVPDKDIHEMIRKNPFRHVEHAIRDLIDEHANNQTTGQQEPDLAGAESLPG